MCPELREASTLVKETDQGTSSVHGELSSFRRRARTQAPKTPAASAPGIRLNSRETTEFQFRRVALKRQIDDGEESVRQAINAMTSILASAESQPIKAEELIGQISKTVTDIVVRAITEDVTASAHSAAATKTGESLPQVQSDPLAEAKLRGNQSKLRILEAEGGTLSTQEVADSLGIHRQTVHDRLQKGELIALTKEKRGYRFPVWQFTEDGLVLEGLPAVLAALKDQGPWIQAAFMLNRNRRLDGARPLDLMRRGEWKRVINAAERFGEQSTI